MSKTKVRSTVSVAVEDFDNVRHEVVPINDPIIERPVFKSELGGWWEGLVAIVLLIAFSNVLRSSSLILGRLDVVFALLLIVMAVSVASISGRFAGQESKFRKIIGLTMVAAGLGFAITALIWGPLPQSSHWTSAAIGLTISGWAMRRLLGESQVRCLSFGLAAALPLGFLAGGYVTSAFGSSVNKIVDQSVFWYTSVLADMYNIPNAPEDNGIKFTTGELLSAASFGNFTGVLVALGASIGFSILARHSLLVAALSAAASFLWWIVFRAGYCLNMGTSNTLDGPMSDLAMPVYALMAMLILIGATNICIGAIMAEIPVDPAQFEVSALTQIYNAFVSFPQLGPSHSSMLVEKFEDAPQDPIQNG